MSLIITNVRLAHSSKLEPSKLFTIRCRDGIVTDISNSTSDQLEVLHAPADNLSIVDGKGAMLLPSLCHSHIHLDKCYILEKGESLVTSDFQEALRVTSHVKAHFKEDLDDLYARGSLLVRQSVESGVTSMRAHVEVDRIVDSACLKVADRIRKEWSKQCDIHIAVFMQEPFFDAKGDTIPGQNPVCLARALSEEYIISAIGSAPYVEHDDWQAKWNIRHIIDLAMKHDFHVDFHLDYNLSTSQEPLIYYVIDTLMEKRWLEKMPGKVITIGHATRLTLFNSDEYRMLRQRIGELPIVFVGLPQSDVYMMGRNDLSRPRGTLCLPRLSNEFNIDIAMSVNNVGNAFTPQGYPDPLMLCPLGVAIYQAGAEEHCRTLLSSITLVSKRAIGDPKVPESLIPIEGDIADFVILQDNKTLWSTALSPSWGRITIKSGVVVARREVTSWLS